MRLIHIARFTTVPLLLFLTIPGGCAHSDSHVSRGASDVSLPPPPQAPAPRDSVSDESMRTDVDRRIDTRNDDALKFSLEGTYLYGPAHGFVQTPSGGNSGTTSHHRPRLSEIGIDDASVGDAEGRFDWGEHHEVYVGGQWVRLSGNDVLGSDLTSQGRDFPAGTSVHSDVKLDWYRAGYRYRFDWDDPDTGRPLVSVSPGVGIAVLDFGYQLDGGGEHVDRSYIKAGPQLGVETVWHATDRFSLSADVLASLPISNMPFILKGEVLGRYRVVNGEKLDVSALLGVAFERLSYQDNQHVSNNVQVDLGPMLVAGLEFRF